MRFQFFLHVQLKLQFAWEIRNFKRGVRLIWFCIFIFHAI